MKKIRIPIISETSMKDIADLVSKSKKANKKSQSLLASAKKCIEELIEQNASKKSI